MASATAGGRGGGADSDDDGGAFHDLDQAPIPFVTVNDDDKFEVNPEAVKYLRSLTGKIAVVAIAGTCLAQGRDGIMQSSPTAGACTDASACALHPPLPLQASTARARATC
jgi:hypothetical protein